MSAPIAYRSGEFIPAAELMICPQDSGFVLGVTVAEQLRTFGGRLFGWNEHLKRLTRGLEIVGLVDQLNLDELRPAAEEVVCHNHALLDAQDDLGVTIFVTPGRYAAYGGASAPTVGIHTYPLPFSLWAAKYDCGQRCVISSVRQVDDQSWPRALKCRSRMHYYLADRQATQIDAESRALLLDRQGDVNEATTANVIALFSHEGLVSPPLSDVLPGVSLQQTAKLAAEMGLDFTYRRLPVAQLRRADEILLTSTPYCILPVSSLDNQPLPQPSNTMASRLLAAWSRHVGIDISTQAKRFAQRRCT